MVWFVYKQRFIFQLTNTCERIDACTETLLRVFVDGNNACDMTGRAKFFFYLFALVGFALEMNAYYRIGEVLQELNSSERFNQQRRRTL